MYRTQAHTLDATLCWAVANQYTAPAKGMIHVTCPPNTLGNSQTEPTSPAHFAVGDKVTIHGLTGAPEHNGKAGVVLSFNAKKGRYQVEIELLPKPLGLKPGNLTKV